MAYAWSSKQFPHQSVPGVTGWGLSLPSGLCPRQEGGGDKGGGPARQALSFFQLSWKSPRVAPPHCLGQGCLPRPHLRGERIRRVGWCAGSLGTRRGGGWGRSWKGSQLTVCLMQGGHGRARGDQEETPAGNPACGAERLAGKAEAKTHPSGLRFPAGGVPWAAGQWVPPPAAPPPRQRQPHPSSEGDSQSCVPILPGVPQGQNQPRSTRRTYRLRFR